MSSKICTLAALGKASMKLDIDTAAYEEARLLFRVDASLKKSEDSLKKMRGLVKELLSEEVPAAIKGIRVRLDMYLKNEIVALARVLEKLE